MIRKRNPRRVHRSAFECSKVLVCTCLLGILKHRKYTAYAINPCIHAGFTHFRLIESLPLRHISTLLFPTETCRRTAVFAILVEDSVRRTKADVPLVSLCPVKRMAPVLAIAGMVARAVGGSFVCLTGMLPTTPTSNNIRSRPKNYTAALLPEPSTPPALPPRRFGCIPRPQLGRCTTCVEMNLNDALTGNWSCGYTLDRKTAISIPNDLFDGAERLARRTRRSRSRLFTDALREYLVRHAPDEVTESMDQAIMEVGEGKDEFVSVARRRLEPTEW